MAEIKNGPFGVKTTFSVGKDKVYLYKLDKLENEGIAKTSQLPFSIKILLENLLRHFGRFDIQEEDIIKLAQWSPESSVKKEFPFMPARVVLQDFTGVPAIVDLAAMRSAMKRLGGDPKKIEPRLPSQLVIDHSIQVDTFGTPESLRLNMQMEFKRNRERYEFLKWGQQAFKDFEVIPPGVGIVHQVNLEYFGKVVFTEWPGATTKWSYRSSDHKKLCQNNTILQACSTELEDNKPVAFPDSLVGTDSHTTMINGLGILGWGVGGIEAEALILGQPIYILTPEVIGFKLTGQLTKGATATDLVLTITEILRKKGVVGKFVEFYGPGLSKISLPDRATVANMAPEYGATIGFFPIDSEALSYLRRTGRTNEHVELVERYTKEQGLFRTDSTLDPVFTDKMELDLSTVEPVLAGPKRPQDRVKISQLKETFQSSLTAPFEKRGFNLDDKAVKDSATITVTGDNRASITHGTIVIAAITSCTNTSNPFVMLSAGILAKKAVEKGLKVPPYVKTSLAPGSRIVTDYLDKAGLSPYLEKLGFHTVGYGCTTCIGNSGPLPEPIAEALKNSDIVAASVLSGNRNFEGRINNLVKANFLGSPPLVVAYAIAGSVNININKEPLGLSKDGKPVFLKDIWPEPEEVQKLMDKAYDPEVFKKNYRDAHSFNPDWNKIPIAENELFDWKPDSTYIQEPPFFAGMKPEPGQIQAIEKARVLVFVGDSVTTDHISPAGAILPESPAGRYLLEHGVEMKDFNSYGSRRGNDQVMIRGTFGNVRIKNLLVPGSEGSFTIHFPDKKQMWIYEAAMLYKEKSVPLVVIAGKEYGTGSSRDWAAKGTFLLGVKAVLAESYERIHRSNLVGMGVLPLQFKEGETAKDIGLTGHEKYLIKIDNNLKPLQEIEVIAENDDGNKKVFTMIVRIDSPMEMKYYRNEGILQTVLREML